MADVDAISILDIVKQGGYEASLITSFNATLPFYEEVVLRRLVAAGARHNVVLMDAAQCAQSFLSEASRPRIAGHAYTLVPMRCGGAFHPKIFILAGPKKASILIGSHNVTLSGFGYNREVTNWIDVNGAKDAEGVAALADAWHLIEHWIELQRPYLPAQVVDAAMAFSNFVQPLTQRGKAGGMSGILGQTPGGKTLWSQILPSLPSNVNRIAVVGAFFDAKCDFVRAVEGQWPLAEVVVAIDPETVQLSADVSHLRSRFVDARQVWEQPAMTYLHAKALYFEGDSTAVLVSGSANPSWPAWMTTDGHGNTEAIMVRTGALATATADSMGILESFAHATLDAAALEQVAARTRAEVALPRPLAEVLCVGVADPDGDMITLQTPSGMAFESAIAMGASADDQWNAIIVGSTAIQTRIRVEGQLVDVRSLLLQTIDHGPALRVVVHHPAVLSGLGRTKRQAALREALGALGSGETDVERLIAIFEKVIFSEDVSSNLQTSSGGRRSQPTGNDLPDRPESLAVHVADMPRQRKKTRLLKSGDLAYLLDVLIRRLGLDLPVSVGSTDSQGRTEEESVGKDDDAEPASAQIVSGLTDIEIAAIVTRKSRLLIRRMVEQLELAAKDENRVATATVQLVAVLGVVRELRRLRNAARWRIRPSFVDEKDRRNLLDRAMAYLFGNGSMLLSKLLAQSDEPVEEVSHLRSLLLWLAWDLGEELTDRISPLLEKEHATRQIHANAILYELLPVVATDQDGVMELERSMQLTSAQTAEEGARATAWLTRHLGTGRQIAEASQGADRDSSNFRVGGLAAVPGANPRRLRVVTAMSFSEVSLWEFDGQRTFDRRRAAFF